MSLTKLFAVRDSLGSDIPARDGKIANLFYSVGTRHPSNLIKKWQGIFLTAFQQKLSEKQVHQKKIQICLPFKKRNHGREIVPLKFLGRKASLQYMGNG